MTLADFIGELCLAAQVVMPDHVREHFTLTFANKYEVVLDFPASLPYLRLRSMADSMQGAWLADILLIRENRGAWLLFSNGFVLQCGGTAIFDELACDIMVLMVDDAQEAHNYAQAFYASY